jgi:hypothetical protein
MYCYANSAVNRSPLWQHFEYLELVLSNLTSYPSTWIQDYQTPIKIRTLTQGLPQKDDEPETFPFFIHQTRNRFHEILRSYLGDAELRVLEKAEIKEIKENILGSAKKSYNITIIFSTTLTEWEMTFYFDKKYVIQDLLKYPSSRPIPRASCVMLTKTVDMSYDELRSALQRNLGTMSTAMQTNNVLPVSPLPLPTAPTAGSPVLPNPPSFIPLITPGIKIGGGAFRQVKK